MVQLLSVTKDYGRLRAVHSVSLTLNPGVVTGLLGPNGAGKSTIIKMITCLLAPSAGQVLVSGHDTVMASADARRCIGYLPEFAPLYPEMTAESYLRYRAGLFGLRGSPARDAVERALAACWLLEARRKRIGAMSKGYRQRVGLAASILHDPKVLILDEPTTGLDPTQIRETRDLLRRLATDGGGRVVLLSSHILPEVEQTCSRIIILARGTVRADGTPDELTTSAGETLFHVELAAAATPDRSAAFWSAAERLPGVARCTRDAAGRLTLTARDGADLREPLARLASDLGVGLRELHRERPSLERLFMRAVADDPAPAQPAAGAAA